MKTGGTRTQRATTAVGDVLEDVLKRVDPEQLLPAYRIWTFWNDEVGNAIAQRAQPAGFRNGILFVTVATHSWMQELQFMKQALRDRLNARLGAALVRDIFFASGTLEGVSAPNQAPARTIPGDRNVPLPPLSDPALAAAFARIVTARARRVARPGASRSRNTRPKNRR